MRVLPVPVNPPTTIRAGPPRHATICFARRAYRSERRRAAARQAFGRYSAVLADIAGMNVRELAKPSEVKTATTNIAGVAIGISCLSCGHWAIHGLVMGLLFSIPLAFSGLMAPDNPDCSACMMFIMTIVMGMIYGLLIEVITSVLFRARMQTQG